MAKHEIIAINRDLNPKVLSLVSKCRLRTGYSYKLSHSEHTGLIIDKRLHTSNQRLMYRLKFDRAEHQKMFGHTYFYADDLEVI